MKALSLNNHSRDMTYAEVFANQQIKREINRLSVRPKTNYAPSLSIEIPVAEWELENFSDCNILISTRQKFICTVSCERLSSTYKQGQCHLVYMNRQIVLRTDDTNKKIDPWIDIYLLTYFYCKLYK
jgi:hypothetical protein